jgi:hypothetical protein
MKAVIIISVIIVIASAINVISAWSTIIGPNSGQLYSSQFSNLSSVKVSAESTGYQLVVDSHVTANNLTVGIPSKVESTEQISIASGKTLTIGDYQPTIFPGGIISGSGLIMNLSYVTPQMFGAISSTVRDNTIPLQKAIIETESSGGLLYIPTGTYNHTGLTINRAITIKGDGMLGPWSTSWDGPGGGTILNNIGTGPGLTIAAQTVSGYTVSCITIEDIALTSSSYASSHGLVIQGDGGVHNINRVSVMYAGGHGIYIGGTASTFANTSVVNLTNCIIMSNQRSGIYGRHALNGQINAINIMDNQIQANGTNKAYDAGVNVWGNNINILRNTIQGNLGTGVMLTAQDVRGIGSTVQSSVIANVNIQHNYMEINSKGNIQVRPGYNASTSIYQYIVGLNISDNYSYQSSNVVLPGITAHIQFSNYSTNAAIGTIESLTIGKNVYYDDPVHMMPYVDFGSLAGATSTLEYFITHTEYYGYGYPASRYINRVGQDGTAVKLVNVPAMSNYSTPGRYWAIGDTIPNSVPSQLGSTPNKYIIKGWTRITTGTGNMLNRDWVENRSHTGN